MVEDSEKIRTVVINRPEKLNALNGQVIGELAQVLAAAAADEGVRAVVITGSGEKAFVAGADIAEFVGLSPAEAQAFAARGQAVFSSLEALRKPVIAAVNGFALGGGCELALACHLRVAASNARFGQPEVKLGLIPGYGGTQRLARTVGMGRALELLLTGRMIDAPTALAWGLVNRVVEPAELRSAARALANEVLAVSPMAVSRCLEAVTVGADLPLERGLELEASRFGLCFETEDMREGASAFLEKRAPVFPGR